MRCFSCFKSTKEKTLNRDYHVEVHENSSSIISTLSSGDDGIAAQTFSFREVSTATRKFSPGWLMGEGEFGCLYKGTLSNGQVVGFKHFNGDVYQGNREFLVDVQMLSRLHHPNLVNLIGYCADGDHRFLVYEFMPLGYFDDHLHYLQSDEEPLDWNTRMNIAAGVAKGLEYLHDNANPPVIHKNLKLSNILLSEEYSPKLSDFVHAKLGPARQEYKQDIHGYSAPEYLMTGEPTVKSDIYSFGVVLLELITGRRAFDYNQPFEGRNLVAWARPLFNDRINFAKLADSSLQGKFPMRGLYETVAVASMCIQKNPAARPPISTVVTALSDLINGNEIVGGMDDTK